MLVQPLQDSSDNLVYGQVAGVHQEGIRRLGQGRVGPLGIHAVPGQCVGQHLVVVGWQPLGYQLFVTAAGPNFGGCGHEYLQGGIGQHHGADVAPHHDYASQVLARLLRNGPLLPYQFLPHPRNGGHRGNALIDIPRPEFRPQFLAVQQNGSTLQVIQLHGRVLGQFSQGAFVLGGHRLPERQPGDGAVHDSGIQEGAAQPPGQFPTHGSFSGGYLAVYGDFSCPFSQGNSLPGWTGFDT